MRCTEFGFEFGSMRKYAVAVPGSPNIEAGSTVTVVLKQKGNWQTLLGWINHKTGEIACKNPAVEAGSLVFLIFGVVFGYAQWPAHPFISMSALLVGSWFFMGGMLGIRDVFIARALLVAKRDGIMGTQVGE